MDSRLRGNDEYRDSLAHSKVLKAHSRTNDEWKGSLAHSKAVKAHFHTHDNVGSRLAAIFCRFPAQTAIRGTPRNRIDHGRHAG